MWKFAKLIGDHRDNCPLLQEGSSGQCTCICRGEEGKEVGQGSFATMSVGRNFGPQLSSWDSSPITSQKLFCFLMTKNT